MSDNIVHLGNGSWAHQSFLDAEKKAAERFNKRMAHLLFNESAWEKSQQRIDRNKDTRKWAWIIVGKTRKMAWVDNVTMKAYKADGYSATWIEWKKFTFERWCTSFDL